MRYLQPAIDLAKARGYFNLPKVLDAEMNLPGWFRRLATREGIAEVEIQHQIQIPAALQEFYSNTLLACFIDKVVECEVFLENYEPSDTDHFPFLVYWWGLPHLVFSFHCHSGMVFAAKLGTDDPLCFCGWEGEPEPYQDPQRPPEKFSEWICNAFEIYEARLDK